MRKVLALLLLITQTGYSQANAWEKDAAPLHRAQKALTDVIIHDIFSPPVASRVYAYTNLAAYEILVKENPGYKSFYQQVNELPNIPKPIQNVSSSLSAVYAFMLTGKSLVFSEELLQDSINDILQWYKKKGLTDARYTASLAYGKQVADTILAWAARDHYKETRSLKRYKFLKEEGKWLPTPPVYMAAIEPYWKKIRTLVIDSCSQFKPVAALTFSKDTSSMFYHQAKQVYDAGVNLTPGQRAIASFWDCNPFAVTTEGHLNYAIKKISPGGHWMSIAGVVSRANKADIMKSAAAYTLTSIALFDGFIICWDEKYRSNVIRPESYINQYMDEAWRPLLQTPPFPEYTSGHSVISTAAAAMLTHLFGENYSFDDDTEVEFGLPVRHFSSFTEACNEAAISRFYGGIHYMAAIEFGQLQGREMGNWILSKVQVK